MLELRDAELELADDLARRRSELRGGPRRAVLPAVSPRRDASRRQLSSTSAIALRTSSRSTPRRAPISAASSSACCATSATRAEPGEAQRLERAALASGLGHAGGMRAAACDARVSRTSSRIRASAPARAAARAPASRRRRPPLRRSRPPAAISSASAASVPPTVDSPRALRGRRGGAANSGSRSLSTREQRRGQEDRRVRARTDSDEQGEREVLERVAAEDVQRSDREQRDERRRERARDRPPTARRSR